MGNESFAGVSRTVLAGVPVIGLDTEGDLTAAEAPQFQAAATEALVGEARAVLDLESISFLDSSGLSVLVGLHRALSARGGELRLARPSRDVVAVLELTRLHRLFEIYDTVDEAVTSFAEDV